MKDWDAIRRAYTMADAYFVQLRDEAAADPARSEDVAGREELVLRKRPGWGAGFQPGV